jgi:hypothetical protein
MTHDPNLKNLMFLCISHHPLVWSLSIYQKLNIRSCVFLIMHWYVYWQASWDVINIAYIMFLYPTHLGSIAVKTLFLCDLILEIFWIFMTINVCEWKNKIILHTLHSLKSQLVLPNYCQYINHSTQLKNRYEN